MTTQNALPIQIEEFNNILQTAPNVLQSNKTSVERCNDAGLTILNTIESIGEIDSDELDKKVADYIVKAKITLKKMNEKRSPITQLLTRVSKEFTTLESQIDGKNDASYTAKLQSHRDDYAKKKLEEKKKQEEEALKLKRREDEKRTYRNELSLALESFFSSHLDSQVDTLNEYYNSITLDNFSTNSSLIKVFGDTYHAKEHLSGFVDKFQSQHMTNDDRVNVKRSIVTDALTNDFTTRYLTKIVETKDLLVLKLPSRKAELQEIDRLKKENAEEARKIEEQAKQRELEERKKANEEKEQREKELKAKAATTANNADIFESFNETAMAAPVITSSAKVTKRVKVNDPKGFLEIYQMWFINEGVNMSIEDLEKVHKKMITLCEKKANNEKEFITSSYLTYKDEIKAK